MKNIITEQIKDPRPHISIDCNGKKTWCLVDSGATDNFMSRSVAEILELKIDNSDGFCNTASGRSRVKGRVHLPVKFGETETEIIVYIFDRLRGEKIILGYNTCVETK